MYGQAEDQEKQKKKIIIVSLIMGIIIIVLIGVLISAIVSKNKQKTETAQETTLIHEDEAPAPARISDNSDKSEDKTEEKAEETKLEPVSNSETVAVAPKTETVETDLPQTGAGSVLGLALLAGSATTFVFSKRK
ncbi:hypothetical protein IKE71_00320 [Candidatus Saccharibacteria bacterium]|nr:hypothetical protein [Candidatus Saccharibacteria bacterium]